MISPRADVNQAVRAQTTKRNDGVDEVIAFSNERRVKNWEDYQKTLEINTNRANEGIAADHNLTIPEAILMYGPDYSRIVMSGFGWSNHTNLN